MKAKDDSLKHMEAEIRLRPNLAQLNSKKVQIEHLENENDALQRENNELHNEIMMQKNNFGNHSQTPKLDSVSSKFGLNTQSDSRMVVDEICTILCLEDNDPVTLLDTIRKLEKVVKAVPRMEGFIHNLSFVMSDN